LKARCEGKKDKKEIYESNYKRRKREIKSEAKAEVQTTKRNSKLDNEQQGEKKQVAHGESGSLEKKKKTFGMK